MGGNGSKKRLPDSVRACQPMFDVLGLSEASVKKLYHVFTEVDSDGSGELSLPELLDYLKLRKTDFSKRVFSIFDEDQSGEVDFREFVLSLWNYCTLSKSSLVIFAFDLYDNDSSGTMELSEVVDLCKDVYGNDFAKNRLAVQILEKIEKLNDASRGDGEVSLDKFAAFCETHPGLLYPAFAFQQSLQKRIIGQGFWSKLSKQRVTLPSGAQVKIKDILRSHVDEAMFKNLARKDKRSGLTAKEAKAARKADHEPTTNFKQVFEQTGAVGNRRVSQHKALGRASKKIQAAKSLRSVLDAKRAAQNGGVLGQAQAKRQSQAQAKPQGKAHSPGGRDSLKTAAGRAAAQRQSNVGKNAPHRRHGHTQQARASIGRGGSKRHIDKGASKRHLNVSKDKNSPKSPSRSPARN